MTRTHIAGRPIGRTRKVALENDRGGFTEYTDYGVGTVTSAQRPPCDGCGSFCTRYLRRVIVTGLALFVCSGCDAE